MIRNKATYSDFLKDKSFLQWHLTRDEALNDYWISFLKENPDLKEEFEKATGICNSIRINEKIYSDTDLLYQRILQSIAYGKKDKFKQRIIYYLSAAAAVALILLIGVLYTISKKPEKTLAANEEIIGETLPDQNITLLAGGKVITLKQDATLELANGQVTYSDSANKAKMIEVDDIRINTLIVPNGKRSSLVLADGSRIWVNSGTTVNFPSTFGKEQREIEIEGEIFIDVAKSENKPFIVHTPQFDVRVFGTRFNVSAYPSDNEASVVLVNGSVQIDANSRSLRISPNEMAKLRNGDLSKNTVDVSLYTSWIEGIYIFEGTPTSEVLKKIGRYYNISFDGAANLPDKKITGKLFLSENLDDVLSSVSLLTSTEYKREENIIKLIKK